MNSPLRRANFRLQIRSGKKIPFSVSVDQLSTDSRIMIIDGNEYKLSEITVALKNLLDCSLKANITQLSKHLTKTSIFDTVMETVCTPETFKLKD